MTDETKAAGTNANGQIINRDKNNAFSADGQTIDEVFDTMREEMLSEVETPLKPIFTPSPAAQNVVGAVLGAKNQDCHIQVKRMAAQPAFDLSQIRNQEEQPAIGENLPIWGLPQDIQGIVEDVTKGFRCPRDFAVGSLIAAVACVAGKRVTAHDGDNHSNHATIWLMIVSPSGRGKSEPLDFFFKPINKEEDMSFDRYNQELKRWQDNQCKGAKPRFARRLLGNASDEKVLDVLAVQEDATWYADEIKLIFEGLGQYKKNGGTMSANLLSIFCNKSTSIDRVGSEDKRLKHPNLSIVGTTQPETLRRIMGGNKGYLEDGMFQRFLYVFPDTSHRPPRVKHKINGHSESLWCEYVKSILNKTYGDIYENTGAENLHDEVLIKWDQECEEYESNGIPTMANLLDKMNFHLCRWCACVAVLRGESEITADVMRYSIECMEYFKRCGERAFLLITGNAGPKEPSKGDVARLIKRWNPDVSQSQLAGVLGVSQQAVSKFFK